MSNKSGNFAAVFAYSIKLIKYKNDFKCASILFCWFHCLPCFALWW